MKRREFIAGLGGAAGWSVFARGQQAERLRSVSVLMNVDNPDNRASYKAFVQTLEQLGWKDGNNVRLDTRWKVKFANTLSIWLPPGRT